MAKAPASRHVCRQCGYESPKWLGRCPGCGEWGTLEETIVASARPASGLRSSGPAPTGIGFIGRSRPEPISEISAPDRAGRLSTGLPEFDRVLGGGVVAGSIVLLGGDPGVGKSTLLTQVAGHVGRVGRRVLYVSGEESTGQIKMRADRLGAGASDILLYNETDASLIAATIEAERPAAAIVDSIQTLLHPEVESIAGSVSQVRACASTLGYAAKGTGTPIFLVGHVNKEGALAGPRVLEHMVDTVLSFDGDRHHTYRLIRATKNRFGSTDELALFEMRETGLVEVANPSEMLLAERKDDATGSAVCVIAEGSQALLVEVQSLVCPSHLASPRRTFSGVDSNRVNLILAVLEKRVGLPLGAQDVFVNVAGGVRVDEPAADLAIALATASNFHERPLHASTVALGEVGLGGEVRGVGGVERRLREAARMGFTRAIVSARNKKALAARKLPIELVGVEQVRQAIEAALLPASR